MSDVDIWIANNREQALATDDDGYNYDIMAIDCEIISELIDLVKVQPTIADFLAQQKPMLDKTKSKMVSVASIEKFMRVE